MSKRPISILTLFLLNSIVLASAFTFEHPTCKVRFVGGESKKLNELAKEKLKERNYESQELVNGKALIVNDLYYVMDVAKDKKLYKTCIITSELKIASDRIPRKKDQVLYKKEIKRSLPRITFKGMERCKMAVKETFVHIPTCKKVGY